jgi:futalosine hydrolase
MAKNIIGLICAVDAECRLIRRISGARGELSEGRMGNRRIVLVRSGVGIANAAWAATALIERFRPSAIMNFGIAGAYNKSGLKPRDVAAAEWENYADTGVALRHGYSDMKVIGFELLRSGRTKRYNRFPMDKSLLSIARPHVKATGGFLTLSQSTGTSSRAQTLWERYGALCENMEGAAVAHVAARYKIPSMEIRGISNMVEDRDTSRWEIKKAAKSCEEALAGVLGDL